ncbi:MAG: VOC family protein [Gammaproteobacteria bacterium]|nr:VOC family protein [Gammaproteobacteria bacterium]MBI5618761.1 VOC family protein [Gammaproteobacteria bacterium]
MTLKVAYWGFEVSDPAAWVRFMALFGLEPQHEGDAVFFTVDEKAKRIHLRPGPADDLRYQGWEAEDEAEFAAVCARLAGAAVPFATGTAEEAKFRGVRQFVAFQDPNGIPMEIALGMQSAARPFHSDLVPGGFVTGDCGLGHIAAPAADYQASRDFLCKVLDAAVSDYIFHPLAPGMVAQCVFLHTNPRHHSIAYAQLPMPAPKRLHHFMLEARHIEDVGRAYDRVRAAGIPIERQLGQHPNDRMLSFYAVTPSGFSLEFGYGGVRVEDGDWQVRDYDNFSLWGHELAGAPA